MSSNNLKRREFPKMKRKVVDVFVEDAVLLLV